MWSSRVSGSPSRCVCTSRRPRRRPSPARRAADVGQLELARVADDDRVDVALAVEQHADLAVGLVRDLGEVAGELRRDDRLGVDAAAVGAAEGVELARA